MGAGCQVDFYVLGGGAQSAEKLACRLALMAWEQGHRVTVRTVNESAAASLDEIMWDSPSGRFLPHGRGAAGEKAPVRIDIEDADPAGDRDVIINLAESAVPEPDRYARLLEIVPGDEAQRLASRRKFRSYRDQGLDPVSHTIG